MNRADWLNETKYGERLYAIGDIHGQLNLLNILFNQILKDLQIRPIRNYRIICLGDVIDRGEYSRHVIDFLMERLNDFPLTILRGNHEDMLLRAVDDLEAFTEWRRYGGLETIMSFGISVQSIMKGQDLASTQSLLKEKLGDARRSFIETLPASIESGSYYFCHAGIRPDVSLAQQRTHDLMWIRDEFLNYAGMYEKYIVHGHTPVDEIDLRSNRVNIDTGAYLTGRLSCLILEGQTVGWFSTKNREFTSIF